MMKKNSERNAAIRFMKKLFILFIPFIALLAVYFLDDPFMVLKNYERYDQTPVVLNEGHEALHTSGSGWFRKKCAGTSTPVPSIFHCSRYAIRKRA